MTIFQILRTGGLAGWLLAGSVQAAEFAPCADANTMVGLQGSLCARELVTASYDTAAGAASETLTLFVRKFPAAKQAQGSVWLVAGGPGESGASLYGLLPVLRRSFPNFDLIVPDHRGTGYSSRICPNEEAADSPGGMALAGAEWGSCFAYLNSHPERTRQFSLTNAAQDLKRMIEASQDVKPVYLYGVSYGTQLVLRTLQLGKLPVAGVILDSLVPLQTDARWDLSRRSYAVDDVGRKLLAQCDASPACNRGEHIEQLLRRLLALAADKSTLLEGIPGNNLQAFLGSLLDVPKLRERIPYLLKDLEQGRNEELKSLIGQFEHSFDAFGAYPQSPPSIVLTSLISASENTLRPELSMEEIQQENAGLLFTSRLPGFLVKPSLPLYAHDQYFGGLPAQLPPVLVLSGTLDPKTHYQGALSHVVALKQSGKVSLVSVTGAPHFILWSAPTCFVHHTRAWLRGRVPAKQNCVLH